MTPHVADDLTARTAEVLRHAGHDLTQEAVRRGCRCWWSFSRPNGVPLGYVLGHFLPLDRKTTAELDALGFAAEEAALNGGGAA